LIGVSEPWLLPAGLLVESLLVLAFDAVFFTEMTAIPEYRLILTLDVTSVLFSLFWLLLVRVPFGHPDPGIAVIFLALFGGLAILFFLLAFTEIWSYVILFWKSVNVLKGELLLVRLTPSGPTPERAALRGRPRQGRASSARQPMGSADR
jgi:hypothetical protein